MVRGMCWIWARADYSVFAPEKSCILPTFKLLPGGNVNPDCTLCPAREEVPGGSKSESGLGWMIRCDQIPVRRSWLNEDVGEGERYDGGVKVENLLVSFSIFTRAVPS